MGIKRGKNFHQSRFIARTPAEVAAKKAKMAKGFLNFLAEAKATAESTSSKQIQK
jgi:hypothetical protein